MRMKRSAAHHINALSFATILAPHQAMHYIPFLQMQLHKSLLKDVSWIAAIHIVR